MDLQADPSFFLALESGLVPYKWIFRAASETNAFLQRTQGNLLWRKRKRKRKGTEKGKEIREKERRTTGRWVCGKGIEMHF